MRVHWCVNYRFRSFEYSTTLCTVTYFLQRILKPNTNKSYIFTITFYMLNTAVLLLMEKSLFGYVVITQLRPSILPAFHSSCVSVFCIFLHAYFSLVGTKCFVRLSKDYHTQNSVTVTVKRKLKPMSQSGYCFGST